MNAPSLILASASPRRAALLESAGISFEIRPARIDESRLGGEEPLAYAARLAQAKALAVADGARPALGADTIVELEGRLLGKPAGPAEAAAHLALLSGRAHQVITAFCLAVSGREPLVQAVVSRVFFRPLTGAMIAGYVATGESLDKAGGYGLQGRGAFMVEKIEGSLTNVIGLPLTETLAALKGLS